MPTKRIAVLTSGGDAQGMNAAVRAVVRTALEDRMLLQELPGYKEYAEKTRYRLIPGIW